MTKAEALNLIKLLSAMESWALTAKEPLPNYLHEPLRDAMEKLEKIVLSTSSVDAGSFSVDDQRLPARGV